MPISRKQCIALVVTSAVLLLPHLLLRPPVPVDETRYLTVAWEMWSTGDWLVPQLNGTPYSHKPPLLFWLIVGAWRVFGLGSLSARLIAPTASVASVVGVGLLARWIWPDRPRRWWTAAWWVCGSLLWIVVAPMCLHDGLLMLWVVVWIGMLVCQDSRSRWWLWLLSVPVLAAGLLTKGPVALLFMLPPALTRHFWSRRASHDSGARHWWSGLVFAVGGGVGVALLWALPAAMKGGPEYAHQLLWSQTSSRLLTGTVDAHPWYWYLLVLPVMILPWSLWPPMWPACTRLRRLWHDRGVRLAIFWMAPAFVVLSGAASKQAQYLLPLMPAMALLVVAGLDQGEHGTPKQRWTPAAPCTVLLTYAVLPLIARLAPVSSLPSWGRSVPVVACLLAAGIAVSPLYRPASHWGTEIVRLAVATVGVIAVLWSGVLSVAADAFDLRPTARVVAEHLREHPHSSVAHGASYHGQLHYFARLERPVQVVQPNTVKDWFATHSDGVAVLYLPVDDPALRFAVSVRPFRTRTVSVWTADSVHAAVDAGLW